MNTASPELVRIVDTVYNVHGDRHPHLAQVRDTFTRINTESLDAAETRAQLARLRELSHDYRTPADGCEGYRMMDAGLEAFERDVLARIG